ncbi:hypothetical protein [Rhodococcus opacus]|uniref:hypothetical protein n=1 Tax=Rhodococcus opacus TaxID=37919 RepID=UPI0006BB4A41|nr:hypothetical protein [Rhodococcus opacus]
MAEGFVLVADQFDQIVSEPGAPVEYERHFKGDVLDLSSEDAARLLAAGSVKHLDADADLGDPEAGTGADTDDSGDAGDGDNSDPDAGGNVAGNEGDGGESDDDGADTGAPVRPKQAALAKDWENYVVALHEFTDGKDGLTRSEAEASTRQDLIARFGAK